MKRRGGRRFLRQGSETRGPEVFIRLHIRTAQNGKLLQRFMAGWTIGGSFRQKTLDFITAQEAITHAIERTADAVK